jgi:hypothetical protein
MNEGGSGRRNQFNFLELSAGTFCLFFYFYKYQIYFTKGIEQNVTVIGVEL